MIFNTNVTGNSSYFLKSWPAKRTNRPNCHTNTHKLHKNFNKNALTRRLRNKIRKKNQKLTINLRHGGIRMPAKRNSRRASLPKARLTSVTSVTARFKLILISSGLTK